MHLIELLRKINLVYSVENVLKLVKLFTFGGINNNFNVAFLTDVHEILLIRLRYINLMQGTNIF